ncbi:MAG: RpiB/LacA/LacB family sugar-phosphate isomerase [Candidatus Sungbacteria bacterium]|uniref:RpiB/LacA/LacB family sugar-phosphate isomerase n=1 Tax=Candidatus Sungiibacteriota bacterium TaxID=2750080 RepID=A0A931YDM7_9BACT|nr:RpiB/LacA/LacB family sugar-phosphate isomerase [Candidatus Sungbacteria bacterium]MBI2465981.1 RpiB/LacA/LacB family sugar-phosphate isomerase [Candidatus Sungbacteria bacterium]
MIYIGSDHRGYNLKEYLKDYLAKSKIPFKDVGNHKFDPEDDYPDFAFKVAQEVAKNPVENTGVMICSSGLGMVVAANKVKGIRAGLALNEWLAQHGRENDDLNVLSLASDQTDFSMAEKILKVWLESKFNGGEKYQRRVEKIKEFEKLWK